MTTTTYLEWDDQATGSNNNTWGDTLDANQTIFETAIARFLSISTTGGTTILSSAQNRYPVIKVTGALVSNATIQVRTAEKNWIVINGTSGNFTLTVKTSAGTGKTIPRGRAVRLYCDGTNVEQARYPSIQAAQAGGTVNAITATFEPATTSEELVDGSLFIVEAAGANTTTTPTFAPDGLTARTITKYGGQALAAGDIRAAGHKLLLCYDASSTRYELLNPLPVLTSTANTFTANQAITGTALTVATGSTYALTVSNSGGSAGDLAMGSDATYSYIQAFNGKKLYLNNQGNDVVFGSGNFLGISTGGLGYGTGSGGTVTQVTSRATGVTINKTNGAITLVSAAGTTSYTTFTVTNSTVAAGDNVIIQQKTGSDIYRPMVQTIVAGAFNVSFAAVIGGNTEQPVFVFTVIKGATA